MATKTKAAKKRGENSGADLNDESSSDDVSGRNAIDFSPAQLLEKAAHNNGFKCIAHRDNNSIMKLDTFDRKVRAPLATLVTGLSRDFDNS